MIVCLICALLYYITGTRVHSVIFLISLKLNIFSLYEVNCCHACFLLLFYVCLIDDRKAQQSLCYLYCYVSSLNKAFEHFFFKLRIRQTVLFKILRFTLNRVSPTQANVSILTSWFGLMTDAALVDAALRKSGLISNGCSGLKFIHGYDE